MSTVMSTTGRRRAHRPTRGGALAALALLLSVGLTACGGEDSETRADDPAASDSPAAGESPSETGATETETAETEDPEPTEPVCSQVWTAGSVLPERYQGCYDDGRQKWQEAEVYRCSSGQRLVTYQRTFYAVPGEKVIETTRPLARDAAFQKALRTCGA